MRPDAIGLVALIEKYLWQQSSPADLMVADNRPERRDKDHRVKCRIDLESSSDEKTFPIDSARLFIFRVQKSGNQEPAQDKEKVHSDPTHTVPDLRSSTMTAENEQHRHGA